MAKFGTVSMERLSQCHPDLQLVFNYVIRHRDCSVLVGHRNQKDQTIAFNKKFSRLQWPNSKHNKKPSDAIDVSPYPLDWNDEQSFYYFAGYVMGAAEMLGVKLRWGGDWDNDTDLHDQKLMDLVHFERVIE